MLNKEKRKIWSSLAGKGIKALNERAKIKGGIYKMKLLKRLFNEEEGVTLIEYALIAALISVVAIAIIITVGENIEKIFQNIRDALNLGL